MIKILCTFFLLFLGQSVFPSPLDFSALSEDNETLLLLENPEEITAGSEVEFAPGLLKELHKTKIILKADFSSFCGSFRPADRITVKFRENILNLNTAKIIYPFHSFP
ncbi:hypothetical protein [Salinimicrobium sp. TH3]|uniref:hypothetical protein n=1 Tax=Salinimicrobium sp. TH3 TaxID=2997342 RepID=UPI002274333A|nr:hypothetical protein [Salinimicrobium sp. TH3]MCY2688446.1 hypothetical protein [Salinimicrobium sp. TH3]